MAYGQKYYGFTEPRNYGSTTPEHQRKKIRVDPYNPCAALKIRVGH